MQYDDDGDPGEDVNKLEILGIAAPEPRRRRTIAVTVSAAVALVLAGGAAWPLLHEDDNASTLPAPGATGTASASPGGDLGIKGLRTYSHLAADHVVGPVTYPQSPPVGGPHDQVWLACGAYDVPVRKENVVHDLEHGAVWITYQPSLSDSDVAALKKVLPSNGVLSPYPGLSSPVVARLRPRRASPVPVAAPTRRAGPRSRTPALPSEAEKSSEPEGVDWSSPPC